MSFRVSLAVVGLGVLLSGCAQSPWQEQSQPLAAVLAERQAAQQELERNPQALQAAPRDVVRASEALMRAEQLSGHVGGEVEARHFAYLSARYSALAYSKAQLLELEREQTLLERQRGQLHVSLRAARLSSWQSDALDAALTAKMQRIGAEQTDQGWLLTLDSKAVQANGELNAHGQRSLLRLAQFLESNPQRRVRIAGHSDNQGQTESLRLQGNRYARQVAETLQALGVSSSRLQVLSYAGDKPRVANRSSAGQQLNRRVELLLSDAQGHLPAR
ncbi:OmpA family protein [Atopomonas sediminilitoris]|uniref:OmpA family protein n=1 Tax=Atopomonas sediminilitoris TaxID=2919919 RepID=UPI001F4EE72A|nr:OmpA family protein [Atopomonas sediminilitoris]MCJ8169043.1 OmpA family protein [Atopomonas sediminilitoris]